METVILDVEAVSKFGFKAGGEWLNADKEKQPSFVGLKRGDKVEVEKNGKYFHSVKVIGKGEVSSTPSNTPEKALGSPKVKTSTDFRTPDQIMRCEASNAVLGSPSVVVLIKDMDVSEGQATLAQLVDKYYHYILTGSWVKEG